MRRPRTDGASGYAAAVVEPGSVTKELTVGQWQLIDGAMDNLASVERVGGDLDVADRAVAIRERGWEVLRAHPRAGQGNAGWPPDEDPFEVDLSQGDWAFVRASLESSVASCREALSDPRIKDTAKAVLSEQIPETDEVLSVL